MPFAGCLATGGHAGRRPLGRYDTRQNAGTMRCTWLPSAGLSLGALAPPQVDVGKTIPQRCLEVGFNEVPRAA